MRKLFFFISLVASAVSISSCSGRSSEEVSQENTIAEEYGREQAMRLKFGVETDTIEIEKILIDVRVREQSLRSCGEDKLADRYIESFLTTLDSVNPPLRAMIQ